MEAIKQTLNWSASMTWNTLQGVQQSQLPLGISQVTAETVALLPDMGGKIGLFANVSSQSTPLSQNLTVGSDSWLVTIASNTPLLLEVLDANLSLSPASAAMSPRVREAEMTVFADGTTQQSNIVRGITRAGVLADFSGDIFSKISQQPDVTGKDKVAGQSQAQYVCRLVKGEIYRRAKIRITSNAWISTFDSNSIYVIIRPEHMGLVTLTPSSIFSGGVKYLQLPDSPNDFSMPVYAKPYVDTGDPMIRCFHLFAQLTMTSLSIVAVPNFLSDEYCEGSDPQADRMTWIASVVFDSSGSGAGYTLFGQGWQPTIQTWCTYGARVVCYSGLAGNTIAMSATGKSDVPPAMKGTLYAGMQYPVMENPVEIVDRINMSNSAEKRGERRIETNQFIPTDGEGEPPKKMCRRN